MYRFTPCTQTDGQTDKARIRDLTVSYNLNTPSHVAADVTTNVPTQTHIRYMLPVRVSTDEDVTIHTPHTPEHCVYTFI